MLVVVALAGGFGRSERPAPTHELGERVELGRFAYTVHDATVVDRDEDGEAFDDLPWRVLVDVTVENIGEETISLGSRLVGVEPRRGDIAPNDSHGEDLQPGLPRRLLVEVPVDTDVFGGDVPRRFDLWLGSQVYEWSNLLNSGPAWSVPNWSALVIDVPLADERGAR